MVKRAVAVLLAAVAFAAVNADVKIQRGDECNLPHRLFPNGEGEWPVGFNLCPNNRSTNLQSECCVSQCMETLLAPDADVEPWFTVCRGSDNNGAAAEDFEWAAQYCDCPFREYCNFACCPTCDTPKVSSLNQVYGPLKSVGFMASTDNETDHDVFKFNLKHDARNQCPIMFFAMFQTGSQIAIDWDLTVLYMPYRWVQDDDTAYTCEEIIVEFRDDEEAAWCKPSDDIEHLKENQCGLQLPATFKDREQLVDVPARYIAYNNCEFTSVVVLEQVCDDDKH